MEFKAYKKTPRVDKLTFTISEKIDGTNAVLYVHHPHFGEVLNGTEKPPFILAGSRSKWLLQEPGKPNDDNHGFGRWVKDNEEELMKLPQGYHYGEWYGKGINRAYGLKDRRFMLFNFNRYVKLKEENQLPSVVELETVLADNVSFEHLNQIGAQVAARLIQGGSVHVPGFRSTEGIILRQAHSDIVHKHVWEK